MEENKSGIIHVRMPSDKVEELDRLSIKLGLNRSRLIKFAIQRFMNLVERNSSVSDREELIREIRRISEKWKVPRPEHYRPRQPKGVMLVAEEPVANEWNTPKKRGRKKKES